MLEQRTPRGRDTVRSVTAEVFTVPTDEPEADGTLAWESTTLVLVEVRSAGGGRGLGYTYCGGAAASVVRELAGAVTGLPVDEPQRAWERMLAQVRNLGRPGIAACAISAVDIALWDLRARSAGLPLFRLLGERRRSVPIYGSGGFTSYSVHRLTEQLAGLVGQGIPRVKMKIGTDWGTRPDIDLARVRAAREAIGDEAELFVDANGAYAAKQAVRLARRFADEAGVSYFEEPVSSDHLAELAFVRGHSTLDIAAGEYGYDPWYFRDLLRAGAVDILQADASRCLGVTGWLQAAQLAFAFAVPFSAHTVPSVHAHLGCAAEQIAHLEYFHTHARIERLLFDGVVEPDHGSLSPDPERAGLGLEPKPAELDRYRIA
ncbi:MAG: enolase C-terminal domain-like protein [Candidatus Dormiibacterota bacterium]